MRHAIARTALKAALVPFFLVPLATGCASRRAESSSPTPAAAVNGVPAAFDRAAAAETLDELQEDASRCGLKGVPTAPGRATVVFDPASGGARVVAQEEPFEGTQVAPCVARVFGAARVPPFRGPPVTVRVSYLVTAPDSPPAFSARAAKREVRAAIVQCNLTVRSARDVADEVDVRFTRTGAVGGVEFYRFEDHRKLDSQATRCVRKALGSARVAAFASDEEKASVRAFFTEGT